MGEIKMVEVMVKQSQLNSILRSMRHAEKNFAVCDTNKLIGEIMIRFKLTREEVIEYLDELESVKKIVRNFTDIWTREGRDAHLQAIESLNYARNNNA